MEDFFELAILNMYFYQKLEFMKKVIFYTSLFFALALMSSCGIYEKQCPGEGQINTTEANS